MHNLDSQLSSSSSVADNVVSSDNLASLLADLNTDDYPDTFCEPPLHSTMSLEQALVARKTGRQRFYVVTKNDGKTPLGVYTSWCVHFLSILTCLY